MGRFTQILEGFSLTNEDESGDPRFYGYTRPKTLSAKGAYVIMKYDVAGGTYKFFVGTDKDSYLTDWSNRASLTYKMAIEYSSR